MTTSACVFFGGAMLPQLMANVRAKPPKVGLSEMLGTRTTT
jgi:hypothetical protein